MRVWICALYIVMPLALLTYAGCVPSEPRQAPAVPAPVVPAPVAPAAEEPPAIPAPVAPETQELAVAPSNPPSPAAAQASAAAAQAQPGHGSLAFPTAEQLATAELASVTVARIDDELLYTVSGSFELSGTITKSSPEDVEWVFKGQCTFPTGGYTLGTPYSNADVDAPSSLIIYIPVTLPPRNAVLTQALETQSFEHRFSAPNDVDIAVQFSSP